MVTKRYTRAAFDAEREVAQRRGIEIPEAGQTSEITYGSLLFKVETKIEDNGDVTATSTVLKHPWWLPEKAIDHELEAQLEP